jgi:hypothetical protein
MRTLKDHFERLLEEASPNYAYPIKYKLKDYNMVKNFKTSGFLTQVNELEEDPGGRGARPFPGEDAVMTVYDGHSPLRRHCTSNLNPGTLICCG